MFVPELATCNLTFHQIHKFPFHRIAYDYSRADWDGRCDNLKDVYLSDHLIILEKMSLTSVLLLLLMNFVSEFRLELMYIFLIVSIRSSHIHLHGFQVLVVLSWL